MSIKKWPGAIISDVPVEPSGPYQNSSASGVWTLDQASFWMSQGQWPTAGNTVGWASVLVDSRSGTAYWSPWGIAKKSDSSYVVGLQYAYSGGNGYGTQTLISIDGSGSSVSSATQYGNPYTTGISGYTISVDGSDNILCGGRYYSDPTQTGSYAYGGSITKTNAASANLDGFIITSTTSGPQQITGLYETPTGSYIAAGTLLGGSFPYGAVAAYDSSLNYSWGRYLASGTFKVGVSSSGEVLVNSLNQGTTYFYRFSSSGNLLQQSQLNNPVPQYAASMSNLVFDSTNANVIYTVQQSSNVCSVVSIKKDFSAVNYIKQFTASSYFNLLFTPVIDSEDNVYICGTNSSTYNYFIIIKLNSAGVVQWMRKISSNANVSAQGISGASILLLDGNYFVAVMGANFPSYANRDLPMVFKMPIDGQGAGSTFSLGGRTFTYDVETTLTESSSTSTLSSGGLLINTLNASKNTLTVTPAAQNTYTANRVGV